MSKEILSLLLIFGVFSTARSQSFIYDPDKKGKTDVEVYSEGEEKEKKKLLLVSYRPVMHLPDPAGEIEILIKSGIDLDKMYNRVRQSLDVSMTEKFKEGFSVISLLRTNDSTKSDLLRVYGVSSYSYKECPKEESENRGLGNLRSPIRGSSKKKPSRDVEASISGGQLASRNIDRSGQYMNVTISDSNFISYLTAKYDADVMVFVNQFELKKTFNSGEDVAYGKYNREVKVHYSIYDNHGVQLYGNSATDKIFEKQDNITEIITTTFPNISSIIYTHIPGSNRSQAVVKLDRNNMKKAENQDILRKD